MNNLEKLQNSLAKMEESEPTTLIEFIKHKWGGILSDYYSEFKNVRTWRIPLDSWIVTENTTAEYYFFLKKFPAKDIAKWAKELSYPERNYNNFLNYIFDKLDSMYQCYLKEYKDLFNIDNYVFQFICIEEESSTQTYLQLNVKWGSMEREFNTPTFNISESIQNSDDLMKPLKRMVSEIKDKFVELYQLDSDLLEKDNYSNSDNYVKLMQLDGDNILNGYFITHSEY